MLKNDKEMNKLKYYKELSEDLEAIFSSVYDVFYITDSDGNTLRVSQSCEEIWGKSANELIGRNVHELEKENVYSPSVTRLVLERNSKVTSVQSTETGRRLMVMGIPVRNKKGDIERIINVSRDITEVTQMQQEINEMHKLIKGYRAEIKQYKRERLKNSKIIANSKAMSEVLQLCDRISKVDSTVLLYGESGVGKEIMSNYIHDNSLRSHKPYIQVNCAAIPEGLLESELFGYERGAFTGAHKDGKAGLFEQANEGTIQLDEIGEMSHAVQVKLLRVLQEKTITRVGGYQSIPIDVRIIGTTNKNLSEEVVKGRFREDLYYRLNVIPIYIPPLRERKEDILDLIRLFLNFYNNKYMRNVTISENAIKKLMKYSFPGNVRELQNLIERIVVINDNGILTSNDLPFEINKKSINNKGIISLSKIAPHKQVIEETEKLLFNMVLEKHQTLSEMADVLEIDPSTVSRKLKRYSLNSNNEQ